MTKKKDNKTEKKVNTDRDNKKEIIIENLSKNCINHNSNLIYFCESCIEPVCEICIKSGPHNNQLHRISILDDSFNKKYDELNKWVISLLKNKKDQLEAQIYRVDYRIEGFKYIRRIIERDIRCEYNTIIERLNNSFAEKNSILNTEMNFIQKKLDEIENIILKFTELNKLLENIENKPNSKAEVFMIINNLTKEINIILNQYINNEINIDTNLPREIDNLDDKLNRINILEVMNNYKNKIIEKLFYNIYDTKEKYIQKINENLNKEIEEWKNLTEKYYSEINNFQLVCHYCCDFLNDKNINKFCKKNNHKSIPIGFKGFSIEAPSVYFNGNNKHYFAKPNKEMIDNNDFVPFNNLDSYNHDLKVLNLKNNSKIHIEKTLSEIKTKIIKDNINIYEIFKEHDTKNINLVNHITFSYFLNEFLDVSEDIIVNIIDALDPNKLDCINYVEFLKLVEDADELSKLPYFENIDKEILKGKNKIKINQPEKEVKSIINK